MARGGVQRVVSGWVSGEWVGDRRGPQGCMHVHVCVRQSPSSLQLPHLPPPACFLTLPCASGVLGAGPAAALHPGGLGACSKQVTCVCVGASGVCVCVCARARVVCTCAHGVCVRVCMCVVRVVCVCVLCACGPWVRAPPVRALGCMGLGCMRLGCVRLVCLGCMGLGCVRARLSIRVCMHVHMTAGVGAGMSAWGQA